MLKNPLKEAFPANSSNPQTNQPINTPSVNKADLSPVFPSLSETLFRLPVNAAIGTLDDFFGPLSMQAYRVEDLMRLFGIPVNTVRGWIKEEIKNCIPIIRIGKSVYFPAQAFRVWFLQQGYAKPILNESIKRKAKKGSTSDQIDLSIPQDTKIPAGLELEKNTSQICKEK
jgi:hypothetical protein